MSIQIVWKTFFAISICFLLDPLPKRIHKHIHFWAVSTTHGVYSYSRFFSAGLSFYSRSGKSERECSCVCQWLFGGYELWKLIHAWIDLSRVCVVFSAAAAALLIVPNTCTDIRCNAICFIVWRTCNAKTEHSKESDIPCKLMLAFLFKLKPFYS